MLPDRISSNSKSEIAEASKYKSSTLVLKSNGLIVDKSKARSSVVSSVQKRRLSVDPSSTSSSASTGLKSSTDKGSPKLKIPHSSKSFPSSPKIQEPNRITVPQFLDKNKIKPKVQPTGKDYEALWTSSQEELKKKVEQLALLEKEKAQTLTKLNQTQKYADDSDEKLRESLLAQKQAEDDLEIEKFRATEIEQTGIEKLQKLDEVWNLKMADLQNQHALEHEKMKKETKIFHEERNEALARLDEANRISDSYAQKVQSLSTEYLLLKSSLVTVDEQNNKIVTELSSHIDSLEKKLEIANGFEKKYDEISTSMDRFKAAESHANNLVTKLEEQVEYLQIGLLESEEKHVFIKKTESEILEKVSLLEIKILESENRRLISEKHASKMEQLVQELNKQIQILQEKNSRFSKDEKSASSRIDRLLKEEKKMTDEIRDARIEEQNSRTTIENLTSALHDSERKLTRLQTEKTNSYDKLEHMKILLNSMKDEHEIQILSYEHFIESSRLELSARRSEWEQTELRFEKRVEWAEESKSSMESEITSLQKALKQAELDKTSMSERIHEKETDFYRLTGEKHELQKVEIASAQKVAELTERLKQTLLVNDTTESDSDYDLLQKENTGSDFKEDDDESRKKDEHQMWESCRIGEEEASAELKSAKNTIIHKKTPLFARFGSILKKRTNSNIK